MKNLKDDNSSPAAIKAGSAMVSPSGNALLLRFENAADHSRCTLTGVVDGAPTYSVNGGPPISLHDPIWSKNRDFVLYPLNPQPVIKILDDADGVVLGGTGWQTATFRPDETYGMIYYGSGAKYSYDNGVSATYTFDLVPGEYVIHTISGPSTDHTTRATHTVYDGDVVCGTFDFDQREVPSWDLTDLGWRWSYLGRVKIAGTKAVVKITNSDEPSPLDPLRAGLPEGRADGRRGDRRRPRQRGDHVRRIGRPLVRLRPGRLDRRLVPLRPDHAPHPDPRLQ
jgi:hypothetical protein